jgi:hypothetical protein
MVYLAVLIVAGFSCSDSQQLDSLRTHLIAEPFAAGWTPVDTARIYRGIELFNFIDGGADLFLEYGFRQTLALEYKHNGTESITLEIYQMTDPAASYGIYSVRSGAEARPFAIGDGGSSHAYYTMFWKGAFYVSVAASDSSEVCRKGMEGIARTVDGLIHERGQHPVVVGLLPGEGMLNVKYVRGLLGVFSARILDIKELFPIADAAIGTYRDHTILLMRYTDSTEARTRSKAVKGVLNTGGEYTHSRTEGEVSSAVYRKHQTVCFAQEGIYLIISVSATDTIARNVCSELALSLKGKKN